MGCVHAQSQNQRSSFLPTVHCSCWLKSNFKAYASKLCQSMLNYAQPKTVPGLYKEGKTPGYYSNEIFKHFLQSCGSIVQRNKFIRNWFQYNKLPSFLPSLGIVVFTIIQGYIQISPCMKPLVCMQGMNLLLWSVNSSTSNHAFLNHSDRTDIWRKHFCCLVINNDSVPTLTPSECTLLLNLPGCTKKIVPIGVSSDMYARKRFWKEGFVPS